MKLIALKVDVDTCRGALEGVPHLLPVLQARDAHASFFFNLGPDRSGRALGQIMRGGWRSRGTRLSLLEHYGWRTCFAGTLLPAPDMGQRCAEALRSVCAAGHEAGIRSWERLSWTRQAAQGEVDWTMQQLQQVAQRYEAILSTRAPTFAAPAWQINRATLRWQQQQGMRYASDTRGTHPFWPVIDGEPIRCLQLPTTLPTLTELTRQEGFAADQLLAALLQRTENETACGHVFTLSAEFEGMKWLSLFERLLDGWRAQGYRLVSLNELAQAQDLASLSYHEVIRGEVPGFTGSLAVQGRVFPA